MLPFSRIVSGMEDSGANNAGWPEQSWLLTIKRGANCWRRAASKASLRPSWSVSCAGTGSARQQTARSKSTRTVVENGRRRVISFHIRRGEIAAIACCWIGKPTSQTQDVGHPIRRTVQLALLGGGEALVDLVPVHGVPPGLQVIGTLVLILEVIGVLPHVIAQHGVLAVGDGIVLVGCGDDG